MKNDVITFKVDPSLAALIERVPNKSEFIRKAILAALANTCPLCQGTGVLTAEQREHWDAFNEAHKVQRCGDCKAVHLECDHEEAAGHHTP
jgi:transposase